MKRSSSESTPPAKRAKITLVEKPDMEKLRLALTHPSVKDPAGLRKYYAVAKAGGGAVAVTYNQKASGRLYPDRTATGVSSIAQQRNLRSTLFADTLVDIDLVNCHPTLLLIMAKEVVGPDEYTRLELYVSDRSGVAESNGFPLGTAKKFVTTVLYGGSVDAFRSDSGWDGDISDFWLRLKKEIRRLAKKVWKKTVPSGEQKEIDGYLASDEWTKSHPGKRAHTGTRLSMLLQSRETKIVLGALAEMQSLCIPVASYQYDGFQVPKTHEAEVRRWVDAQQTAHRFAIKPFGPGLPPVPFAPFNPTNAGFVWSAAKLKEDADAEGGADLVAATQARIMSNLEQYTFKVMAAGFMFTPDREAKPVRIDSRSLSTRLQNVTVPVWNEKTKEVISKPIFEWWVKQRDMRQCNLMAFCPPPIKCQPDWYNTFRGFKAEDTAAPTGPFDPSLFVGHCRSVMEGNEAWGDFLLDLLAHRVQKPGQRTGICLVVIGTQGSGKSEFFTLFARGMFYDENVLVAGKSEQIVGKFNQLPGRLIVLWEEANGSDTAAGSDRMKHLITAGAEFVEQKNVDAVQHQMCFLPIITSNNAKPVHIEVSDRRFVVVKMGADHMGAEDYFTKLYGAMEDPTYMRGLFDWLRARDISKYRNGRDWSQERPLTQTYRDIQSASKEPVDRWFDCVAAAAYDGSTFDDYGVGLTKRMATTFKVGKNDTQASAGELGECFDHWRRRNRYEFAATEKAFAMKLSSFCKDAVDKAWISKTKTGGYQKYTINTDSLIGTRGIELSMGDIRKCMGDPG